MTYATTKTRRTMAILEALAPTPPQLASQQDWTRYEMGRDLIKEARAKFWSEPTDIWSEPVTTTAASAESASDIVASILSVHGEIKEAAARSEASKCALEQTLRKMDDWTLAELAGMIVRERARRDPPSFPILPLAFTKGLTR